MPEFSTPSPRPSPRKHGEREVVEYVDILTPEGKPTGEKKPKSEVHRAGDWHAAVHIWIYNPDEGLLFQRRAAHKENHPGLWDISCAGHLSAGDTPLQGALRELKEELGLSLEEGDLKFLFSSQAQFVLNGGTYIDNEWLQTFLAVRRLPLSAFSFDDGEVAEVKYIPVDEFERILDGPCADFVPHAREYRRVIAEVRGL